GLTGRLLAPTIPLIVDTDDWEGDGGWNQAGNYSFLQRRLFAWQERDLLRRADAVTAASLLLAKRASLLRSQCPDHVTWIPNGLDAAWAQQLAAPRASDARTNADPNESVIVLYSRFAEFPADWLARYLHALSSRLPPGHRARLMIVGDPPDPGAGFPNLELRQMGYVALDRIPLLLSRAQIALFPYVDSLISRSKNSVKLLELMASGCAIVASNVGDVPAVVGDAAVLVNHDSPGAFADATLELARNPERVRRLSASAQRRATTNFSLHAIAGRLAGAYQAAGVIRQ
ncbi:MAG: glycosyltransferase, partial [Thermomicrobiales bacterium]